MHLPPMATKGKREESRQRWIRHSSSFDFLLGQKDRPGLGTEELMMYLPLGKAWVQRS